MSDQNLSGSCLCGAVRYTARGEPRRFLLCQCSRCRKATGSAGASNLFLKGVIEWTAGEEEIAWFRLPEAERFGNSFCRRCGSRLPRFIEEAGVVMIPAGSLDEEPDMEPQARIFTGSRAEWARHDLDLPCFEEYPTR
jgi:hypothetical protein